MKITYGTKNVNIDVTQICLNNLTTNNITIIPSNDHKRAGWFTDPIVGVLKSIFITDNNNIITEYDHKQTIQIDLDIQKIFSINENNIDKISSEIHNQLKIKYGTFQEELPEQKMALRYLTGYEKVLEIGGNIGRNSLVIAHILGKRNNNKFVTLESDSLIAQQLIENRDLNKFTFHIENSALSKRKLIQCGWDTKVSDILLEGYKNVDTITLDQLYSKYNIDFDTLVLDCEGAFYYILMDMPEILNNVNLIIMENDYHNIYHKNYVDTVLKKYNFKVNYQEIGGWGPCQNRFFEVWRRVRA
jgi:FkbM family methyltransferase